MSYIKDIKLRRDKLAREIEGDEVALINKQQLLKALDLILASSILPEDEESQTELFNNEPSVYLGSELTSDNDKKVTEGGVYAALKESGETTTVELTSKIFPAIDKTSIEFHELKYEVSSALTRLKLKGRANRSGSPKNSRWIAVVSAADEVKAAFNTDFLNSKAPLFGEAS